MELSRFGEKFTARTGILELMEDLGKAADGREHMYMLGGGNPALIPEVCDLWRDRMTGILKCADQFERMLGCYDTAKGNRRFAEALAGLLSDNYGWSVTPENIAVTNGSQIAFFYLLNMFGGTYSDGRKKKILFPMCPEYIGYADQSVEDRTYVSCRPSIEQLDSRTFKYHVDFSRLHVGDDVAALCVSRPTNPTGNVLTDDELGRLSEIAAEKGIPLMVDSAYGLPFPGIVFADAQPFWNENVILGMSLSKIGLPSVRSGIVVAAKEIIDAITSVNAICSLATGSIGQAILEPLVRSGEVIRVAQDLVKPFYDKKAKQAIRWLEEALDGVCDYSIHKAEGAFFLWIWFKDLPVTAAQLYERLKRRNVLVIPGHHFFFGLEEDWGHSNECIRINYSQDEQDVRNGIEQIGWLIKDLSNENTASK